MTVVAVIDLSNIFWAAYQSQPDAAPAAAAHDLTVAKINRLAAQFGAVGAEGRSGVGIAVDAKENWRRAKDPTYKAGRAERGPQAWAQLGNTIDTLRAEGYPIWHEEGYEADDIMATVAAQAPRAGHEVVLVTNDKDLRQCIRDAAPSVSVLTPGDSRAQPVRITEANCGIAKMLVAPRLVRDFLALSGDGGDNLPGCKGIGPAKAMELLGLFDTFPGVVAAFEQGDARMPESHRKLLGAVLDEATGRRGIDDAMRTWELVELRTDAPVDWSEALRERVQAPREAATKTRADVARETAARAPASSPATAAPTEAEYEEASSEATTAEPARHDLPALDPGAATLALAPVEWRLQCEPRNFDDMWDMAKLLSNARCFPALKNPEQVHAAMMLGRAHSIPAVIAAMNCYPVKDRMSMSAALIVGLCLRDPRCEYLEWVEGDMESCTWEAKRVGRPPRKMTFTIEQAIQAGYAATLDNGKLKRDGMYYKDSETMLSARCSTRLARRVFPDIVAGLYSTEEMGDE